MKYTLETVRRIYDDSDGVYLEIGPDVDSLNLVQLSVPDAKSKEYYGDIRLTLTPGQARLIAGALISTADEMDPGEDKESKC